MDKHPLSGKVIRLNNGDLLQVLDWWINIAGCSWMELSSSPVCLNYALRAGRLKLPLDDLVVFGIVINPDGTVLHHLVHDSEIALLEVVA